MVKMEWKLFCGYEVIFLCYRMFEEYFCEKEVEIFFFCFYRKFVICVKLRYEFWNEFCDMIVIRKLVCGYEKEMKCLDK